MPRAKMEGKNAPETVSKLKLDAIALGETVYHYRIIANAIGRNEDTLLSWRKTDKIFSARLEEARARFLRKQIHRAKPEFLLERLEPEIFKQRQDITSGDQPLTTALVEFVTPKTGDATDDGHTS